MNTKISKKYILSILPWFPFWSGFSSWSKWNYTNSSIGADTLMPATFFFLGERGIVDPDQNLIDPTRMNQPNFHFHSRLGLPPGRQYPVLFKQLTPLHSSNHIIISLSEIYRHFNGVYRDIQTHELVTIRCSNSTHIESVNVTSRDQRIFCHTLKPPPPFNNFCIERSTWTVRTRENYHPPLNADLVCIMKLRARGFEFDGQPRSNLYKLRIDIQARCTQQRAVREKILATCNPDLVILRPKMRENSFIYEVPQLEHPESVRLYLRKFAERQQSEILQIKINCDNEERSFNMNINTTDVVIDANCKPGTNRLRVSVISNWDRVHLADEQLNYFLMENVCIRQRCLNLHATLRYLLSSSAETDKCVASEFPLRETFDKCLGRSIHSFHFTFHFIL